MENPEVKRQRNQHSDNEQPIVRRIHIRRCFKAVGE